MDELQALRHTMAHILALALQTTYGDKVKFGTGPATENGFYYDVHFDSIEFSADNLKTLEAEMAKIVKADLEIKYYELPVDEALAWTKTAKQDYKHELISDLKAEGEKLVGFYQIGDFVDLCKGPHLKKTGEVKSGSFQLNKVGGAYWRADESRDQMTRVGGVAFATKKELEAYNIMMEEAEKRDHRKLGLKLDLFTFSPLVGAGLPMFTPRGTVLRDKLTDYSLSLRAKAGFEKIWTPHITKTDLFKCSGHWDKFGDELFLVKSQETSDEFAMKPMNCPHQIQIYASRPRTYKDLPVRYMETTTDYRDEKKGELGGLSRVRALTQDDSHVWLRESQIKEEVGTLVRIVRELYEELGMNQLRARLSYRDDSDGYLGEKALWDKAQKYIKDLAIEYEIDYFEAEGEAAFYGPKIDFMARDAIGREHQVATIQIDFFMAGRFGLEFTNEKGEKETPVMLHHATLGSIERFLSVYIEHTAGRFPFWLAPEQARVITVNEKANDYAGEVEGILEDLVLDKPLKLNALRYSLDLADDNLSKKIKRAVEMKIPAIIVVGPRDAEAKTVVVRQGSTEESVKLADLAEYLQNIK
ncbi:threonine--tRNA ligase [Candidatus Saccharibacteria bacterium]|nr:threonine--tRNA ligase [Candidatus Saccharibacteria bacterium]